MHFEVLPMPTGRFQNPNIVGASLRDQIQLEIDAERALTAASHDQTHSSDGTGTCHHYATPKAFPSAEELRFALRNVRELVAPQSTQRRNSMTTTTVRWSVERDADILESATTYNDGEVSVETILSGLRDALSGGSGQGGSVATQATSARATPRQAAIRASASGMASFSQPAASASGDDMHHQTHSEGADVQSGLASRLTRGLEDSMHGQTHSSGGGGGGSLGDLARGGQIAAGPQAAGRLAGQGLASIAEDVMHDQTHSEGGGHMQELSRQRVQTIASGLDDAMHDQTHSEGGGSAVEAQRGIASRLTRGLEDSMHGQTHSSGGGGGGSLGGLARGGQIAAGPQAAGRLAGQGLASIAEDVMHDQTHSEGGGHMQELSRQRVQTIASGLDDAMHDQTHSEGGGSAVEAQRGIASRLTRGLEDSMHGQTHSSGGGGGGSLGGLARGGQIAAGPQAAGRLAGQGLASIAEDVMHDQTHSEGGGHMQELSRQRVQTIASGLDDAMHDQTHSEGGGSAVEAQRGIASRLTRGLEDSMHGQTHSSGGGGGGSLGGLARGGQIATGPQAASGRARGDAFGRAFREGSHLQNHSEGGAHAEMTRSRGIQEPVSEGLGQAVQAELSRSK
ncbi:hypothetical protein [Rhizobium sp. NZLR1]|uniref:hypothetical protein n=1 Tax=Rhizobium sp. NZLR1 TaxID=2731096 RepID=UPI001A994445|nr:hypothetical protein [Rhizobium sp. NZLR1]QSZ21921.1 hypothetical protein J3O30_04955 [Rhizobium sp. NZLR1]